MIHLTVRSIAKRFEHVRVLEGLDLDVEAGEIMAVLGPSGCGKTTLLRLIAGFERADAGRIVLGDRLVTDAGLHTPPARRRIGYVAQEGALFPHLDVARNITFGLSLRQRRGRARVEELLNLVGLDGSYASRRPHELSGGQQQRVAVARALAVRPPLVLLDEPFASLDAGLRQGTGRAVAEVLRAQGAAALLITHDQSEALSLADRVAVMHGGRMAQVGTPKEIYERPADAEVAAFVGGGVVLPAILDGDRARCALGPVTIAHAPAGNARVRVFIRPEQIELAAEAGGDGVECRILGVSYYGHDAEVRLRSVHDDGTEVVARTHGPVPAARGEVVTVTVAGPVVALADRLAPSPRERVAPA